jgi:pimeloyl-ACP methyl ester carboxylesterase
MRSASMNGELYTLMQGPSELGASGLLLNWDRFADLKRITVPTLVIGAQYDTMDPAYMEKMSKELPNGPVSLPSQRQPPGDVRRPDRLLRRAHRIPERA